MSVHFFIFGSLPHVHSASEKWISHVSHRKFGKVVHGHFMVNSTVKLKRIKGPSLKLDFYYQVDMLPCQS
jgi:hypothetical protein